MSTLTKRRGSKPAAAAGSKPVSAAPAHSPAASTAAAPSPGAESKVDTAGPAHPDAPLQIISISADGNKFELHEEALDTIIERAHAVNPDEVMLVSVVGAFRSGKSFLLDLMLRYLYYQEDQEKKRAEKKKEEEEKSSADDADTNSDQTDAKDKDQDDESKDADDSDAESSKPEWVTFGGHYLYEGMGQVARELQKPGFTWRPGKDRTTTGIWMYGKPFAIRFPGKDKPIACILMDTQGMFDLKTPAELTAAIFGLSTLMSSYQVYNISKQIQEDKLEQLNYFTQFSLVALKQFHGHSTGSDNASAPPMRSAQTTEPNKPQKPFASLDRAHSSNSITSDLLEDDAPPPFQRVNFLVRDWQNFEDDEDLDKCLEEMPHVLEDAMDASKNFHDQGTRRQIKAAFEEVSCFLLPHPGLPMTKKHYDGSVDYIENNFLRLLDVFIRRLFNEKAVPKRIQGRSVRPRALKEYIKAYATVFKEGKMPSTMTLVGAIAQTTNLVAKDEALGLYQTKMREVCSGAGAVPESKLKAISDAAESAALEVFDNTATFGDADKISETRVKLLGTIKDERDQFFRENSLKLSTRLVKYIIPVLAAVMAWALDLLTDYTCDSWSSTCRKVSSLTALIYYIVLLALGYEMYSIYKSEGSMAASSGALALAQAVIDKADVLSRDSRRKFDEKFPGLLPAALQPPGDDAAANSEEEEHTPRQDPGAKKNQ